MAIVPKELGRAIADIARQEKGEQPNHDEIQSLLASFARPGTNEPTTADPGAYDPFQDAEMFKGGGGGGGNGKGGGQGRNFDPETANLDGTVSEDDLLTFNLLAGATDKNGDPLSVTGINGQPAAFNTWITLDSGAAIHLTSDGTLTYDPAGAFDSLNDGETALESLTYTVTDDRGGSSTASLDVEIAGVADPTMPVPDAIDDAIEAASTEVVTLEVLSNDIDAAGGGLTVIAINGQDVLPGTHVHLGSGAEVHVNADGTVSYDPTSIAAFTDGAIEDLFDYTVQDANGNVDTATASIYLNEPAPDPTPGPSPEPTPTPETSELPLDAILAGDSMRLNAGKEYGTPETVTFAFADSVPYYYPSSSYVNDSFQAFSEQQRITTREVLDKIESFSELTFVEVAPEDAEMMFGIADMSGDTLGTAFYPTADGSGLYDSDIWIDTQVAGDTFEPGTLGFATLLHEIGHAVGMSHPDSTMLTWVEATRQFTVMGYGEHPGTFEDVSSYMPYDIAALQYLYGTDETTTAGDDTYHVGDEVSTVWDAAGVDTLDVSASSTSADINLNDGAFSSTGGQDNNIAIAFGATIENAIGSDHNDRIIGNEADNILDGSLGNDTLTGGDGADRFSLGAYDGADVITDFVNGEDRLDLGDYTLADLVADVTEGGLMLSHADGWSVTLEGVSEFGEEDMFVA